LLAEDDQFLQFHLLKSFPYIRKVERNGLPHLFNRNREVSKVVELVPCHLNGRGFDRPGNRFTRSVSHSILESRHELILSKLRNSDCPPPSPSPSRGEGGGGGAAFRILHSEIKSPLEPFYSFGEIRLYLFH